eukprot:11160684-Lingulodinium_polyedra.AAC.1
MVGVAWGAPCSRGNCARAPMCLHAWLPVWLRRCVAVLVAVRGVTSIRPENVAFGLPQRRPGTLRHKAVVAG